MRCAPHPLPGAAAVVCPRDAVALATGVAAPGRLVVLLCSDHALRAVARRWPGVIVRWLERPAPGLPRPIIALTCTT